MQQAQESMLCSILASSTTAGTGKGGIQIASSTKRMKPSMSGSESSSISFDSRNTNAGGSDDDDTTYYEPDTEALVQVKELIYRAAAMRPISVGFEANDAGETPAPPQHAHLLRRDPPWRRGFGVVGRRQDEHLPVMSVPQMSSEVSWKPRSCRSCILNCIMDMEEQHSETTVKEGVINSHTPTALASVAPSAGTIIPQASQDAPVGPTIQPQSSDQGQVVSQQNQQPHDSHKQQQLQDFWSGQLAEIKQTTEFKTHSLPLARIKKIMKDDSDVPRIAGEAPVLLAKASEMFFQELTLRAWLHTEEDKRRTLQKMMSPLL
nr:unnamed protein product [Digitaria exilis]